MDILQNSKDKNKILDALSYFTGLFALYEDKVEAIEPIIKLVKKSRRSEIRKKAISALGRIGKKTSLVIPIMKDTLYNDKSVEVRSEVPFALYSFKEEAIPILKEAIELDSSQIRLNVAKVLGHLVEYRDKVLTILKNEISNCKSDSERFEFLLAILNLEGLDSPIREDIELMIDNFPQAIKPLKQIEYKDTIENLEFAIKKEKEEKRIDEKWYIKKDFIQIFLDNLITFKSEEKGFELQEIYSEFIRLVLTGLFLNSITVESLINFPKRGNLPEEIVDILDEDYRKSKEQKKHDEIDKRNSSSKYSSIFIYTRLIQYLSLFNLDYIENKFINKQHFEFEETEFKDILTNFAVSELITPGEPIKPLHMQEKEFWDTKGKQIIEFWKRTFRFDYYLNQQCLVSIIAYFESFLYNIVSLLERNRLNVYYQKNKERALVLKEFDEKSFHSKFQSLKDFGAINPKWSKQNINFKTILLAIDRRNKIVHKRIFRNSEQSEISIQFINKVVTSIALYSNELYNNIAKRIKTS